MKTNTGTPVWTPTRCRQLTGRRYASRTCSRPASNPLWRAKLKDAQPPTGFEDAYHLADAARVVGEVPQTKRYRDRVELIIVERHLENITLEQFYPASKLPLMSL